MRLRNFQLTRIFGIPLIIDYSWPPVVLLHIWLLTQFWLPVRIRPAWPLWLNLLVAATITALFFASVLAHELAHSLIARLEGIRIHDIQLHIFGGWARLVTEPKTAMAEFRVAIAGPASSFILSLFFTFGLLLLQQIGSHAAVSLAALETFYYLAAANIFLAMFNLLPGLPLDGGRALRALLWHYRGDILSATRTTKRMGVGIAYMLISYGLFLIVYGMYRGTIWQDFLLAVWLLVIGVFLKNAAENDYRHKERQSAAQTAQWQKLKQFDIEGTVGSVMSAPPVSIEPDLPVTEFIDSILPVHRLATFPVAREGRLHGIFSLSRLRELPKEKWEKLKVGDIMETVDDQFFINVKASLEHAGLKLKGNGLGFLAVLDPEGFLVGSLTERELGADKPHHFGE